MQPGLERQQKLYYRNKVSDFISSYERQKQEEQRQKADLKKQVMLSILNARKNNAEPQREKSEKSEKSEAVRSAKTNQTDEPPLQTSFKQNEIKPMLTQLHPDARFESEEARQRQNLEEITFNAKRRNKSLEEELTFKESYLNLLRERRLKDDQPREELEEPDNPSEKYDSNDYPPVQRSVYKSSHSSEEDAHPSEHEKSSKVSLLQKYSYLKESLPSRQLSHQSRHSDQEEQEDEEEKKYQYEEDDNEEERERQQRQQRERQREKEREQKGVFLTMEESQSMVAEDGPKNYAFEIKLDKSADPGDLQQLKQQRIREIQRKRQERIEEFRRNQSQKKVEMPRGKNSYSKRPQNNESDTIPPRSATIQRKNNPSTTPTPVPPQPHRNQSSRMERDYTKPISIEAHESQYSIRPNSSKQLPPNPSYHPDPEPRPPIYKQPRVPNSSDGEKPLSPFRTPKSTVTDNNRGKSNGKNANPNIFTIEGERQKSCNKYQVKIEPKDRKNSFTRQSNKKQMINAITHVVFPGELNRKQRERLIDIIEASQYQFFVFLFKEYSRKMIKGIYVFDSSQTILRRIYGEKSPPEITAEMVQEFYKYDNGSREFKRLDGCRSFSFSISAIDLRK